MHHFSFQTEQSIHAPPFPIRIDHTRSAHPLKALKGRADSAWPLPPSLFLFFSLSKDYIGRIYTYIYRARTICWKLGNGNKATSLLLLNWETRARMNIFFKQATGNKVTFALQKHSTNLRLIVLSHSMFFGERHLLPDCFLPLLFLRCSSALPLYQTRCSSKPKSVEL